MFYCKIRFQAPEIAFTCVLKTDKNLISSAFVILRLKLNCAKMSMYNTLEYTYK